MSSLTERMIGAAKLDVAIYEEVEADTTATGQALLVVVLSSVAAGLELRHDERYPGRHLGHAVRHRGLDYLGSNYLSRRHQDAPRAAD